MIFSFNGEQHEAKSVSKVDYGNDLVNGMLLDFPEQYTFLSDNVENQRDFIAEIEEDEDEDVQYYDLSDCEIDWDRPPHSWVLKSVGKMIANTAEQVCIEACDEK